MYKHKRKHSYSCNLLCFRSDQMEVVSVEMRAINWWILKRTVEFVRWMHSTMYIVQCICDLPQRICMLYSFLFNMHFLFCCIAICSYSLRIIYVRLNGFVFNASRWMFQFAFQIFDQFCICCNSKSTSHCAD